MVKINVTCSNRLAAIQNEIKDGFTGQPGAVQDAFKQWAMRYRSEMQLRFNTYSRGGGDWPPLKRSTILARASKPIGRLKKAFARGDINEATFNRRLKATRARVRKEKKRTDIKVSILRDTGLLFNTLDPSFAGAPGQVERNLGNGIEVGIGGPASHGIGPATIGDIASYHQTGAGSLPVREILVYPSAATIEKMKDDLERSITKIIGKHKG